MSIRWLLSLALVSAPLLARAQDVSIEAEYDSEPPDEDWVWEDGYVKPDGTTVDGFYRQRARAGFEWSAGRLEGDTWVEPQWRWTGAARPGFTIVAGHVGPDGYWVPEVWRPVTFNGQVWVEPRREGNLWIAGHWQPSATRAGFVWEAGQWSPSGEWIDGQWRPVSRPDYNWVAGQFRFGVWYPGYWRPIAMRAGFVWVPGHWGQGGWIEGQWRETRRPGQYWVHAHWNGNVWMPGAWAAGARPRRHHIVRPVHHMISTRRAHVRRINVGAAIEARGRVIENRGRAIERHGQRVEIRGQVTGNERMEQRGQAIQNRGERRQEHGEHQQQRGRRVRRGH